MAQRTLVPDAGEVVLESVQAEGCGRLRMVLRASREQSVCPQCGRPSYRVHSRYQRRPSDLPWEGLPVRIQLHVRRFFCDTTGCPQRIFTERLPKTVDRYARRTCRLNAVLVAMALALGGVAASRLAQQLGILASDSTFLRQLRRKGVTIAARAPRVLGIDDWAWRKGHRYGTILCDLERGQVIDLLPDRSAESTEQWLRNHPGVEIVSRDRANVYAEAVTQAARNCGLGRKTVRRWIGVGGFPERKPVERVSMVDAYGEVLEQRWQQGCHNAAQLWRELRQQGFTGWPSTVRNWIGQRTGLRRGGARTPPASAAPPRASPRQTAWLLRKEPEEARPYLEELCRRSPQIATCASLAREFWRMIVPVRLTPWLTSCPSRG